MPAYFLADDGSIRDFTDAEITAMEIETYDIEHGGFPTHTRGPDGGTLKATYFCKFDMFERFVCYMLGACCSFTDGSANFRISRMLPQTWPGKPQIAAVKIDSATGHCWTSDDDEELIVPVYTHMKVVVTFQQLPYPLDTDTNVGQDESLRYMQVMPSQSTVDMLSLPGGTMQYVLDGGVDGPPGTPIPHRRPIPYGIGFPVPTITIARKLHRWPINCWGPGSILYARVFGNVPAGTKPYAGTYNVDTLFGTGGYPPGYALFLGVEEEIEFDPPSDALVWNLTLKWQIKTLAPHIYLYFYSTLAADAARNGWYEALKAGSTFSDLATLPDETGLFNGRQHAKLTQAG